MKYQTTTIYKIVQQVNNGTICLPAIQRKYVWDESKIENLFDSIYADYPIGTFLIWDIPNEKINDYQFYELLREYNELSDGMFNKKRPRPNVADASLQAVLDGQQRITSIYLATQGSFTRKKNRARVNNPNAYVKRYLYFNFLGNFLNNAAIEKKDVIANEEEASLVWFKMMSEDDVLKANANGCSAWYKVHDLMSKEWVDQQAEKFESSFRSIVSDEVWNLFFENTAANQMKVFHCVQKLINKLHSDPTINYSEISNPNLDEVAEIFIRINSGGKVLSKSDLLFSTIVSQWEEAREKIDDLIRDVLELKYEIDTDFVMRACLYLTNSPILFKVGNFKTETIQTIITAFEKKDGSMDIRTAILKTFQFLKNELKIDNQVLKSKNVLIPIIYHIFKGGVLDKSSRADAQNFIYVSLLQKVFGSHGDTLLTQLRESVSNDGIFKLRNQNFNYQILVNGIKDKQKKVLYTVNSDVVESWLDKEYQESDSWLVLSLIYRDLPYAYQSYDKDHLHPKSKLIADNFPPIINFKDQVEPKINTIANLCFSTEEDNRALKRDRELEEYVASHTDSNFYKKFNHIAEDTSLALVDFLQFHEQRKAKLTSVLVDQLSILIDDSSGNSEDENIIVNYPVQALPIDEADDVEQEVIDQEINDITLNSQLIGLRVGNFSYIVTNKPNTTEVYERFLRFIIDNYNDLIPGNEFLNKIFKTDPNDSQFGRGIHYNRIRTYAGYCYTTYNDTAKKETIMMEIIAVLDLGEYMFIR